MNLKQIDITIPKRDRVEVDLHDGNRVEILFSIVSESEEIIQGLSDSNLVRSQTGQTLKLELAYEGYCGLYHLEGGKVHAAQGICLEDIQVMLPQDSNIDIYEIDSTSVSMQPAQVWEGETAQALLEMERKAEEAIPLLEEALEEEAD